MSHKCFTCGKVLSSQQALNYHSTSKSCTKQESTHSSSSHSNLIRSSQTHIICNSNGVIVSVSKPQEIRHAEYIGYSIYDFLNSLEYKYSFSRNHIDALLNNDNSYHNFFINDIVIRTTKLVRTLITRDGEKKIHIFQFPFQEGDLKEINKLCGYSPGIQIRSAEHVKLRKSSVS